MFTDNFNYGYNYNDYELSQGQWRMLVLVAVLQVISWWRLFQKAGEPGWKSIIPFYNIWTAVKIANNYGSAIGWCIGLLIPGVKVIVNFILQWKFSGKFTNRLVLRILYMFFPFIVGLIFAFSDQYQYRPHGINTVYR